VIAAALEAALGAAAVTRTDEVDPDERTAAHVSGRDVGRPICWVRPAGVEALATVVRLASEAGIAVVPVGGATAYWDPLRLAGAIAVDTRSLREPFVLDEAARFVHAGAGWSIREIDQRARRHGLCVAARPDAGGDTPVGALVAVGSTAGLGLGVASPIELVSGATVVSGRGEILRLGASHALHGQPFARHGAPEALGLVAAAEGRGAIVGEVGLLLHVAPHIATVRSRGRAPLAALLEVARAELDRGRLESYRIELVDELEVMARTLGRDASGEALAAARDVAAALADAGLRATEPQVESEAARRGEEPEYEYHWAFPAGEHRARLQGGALWGVEVSVSWRAVVACAARLQRLFLDLAGLPLITRRLAIYPAPHAVTVGVQAIARRGPDVEALVARLEPALPDLLALGAVPYRRGHLWRAALERRGGRPWVEALIDGLDPHRFVRGGGAPPATIDVAFVDAIAAAHRAALAAGRDALAWGHEHLESGPTPCLSLELRPRTPEAPRPKLAPLGEPCVRCGAAAACPASERQSAAPKPLRPLRHGEPLAATLAATRAIAAAWERQPPEAVDDLLSELVNGRVGARSVPPPPFELSLKIDGGRLVPAIRIVEYSATGAWRDARGRERRRALGVLAARLDPGRPWDEWLALVEARQGPGVEISIGVEAPLDGGAPSVQLYAHLDPGDRAAMRRLAADAASWAGASAPLDALFDLALDRPVGLVLLALSPEGTDTRRSKLYLSAPLGLSHAESGLRPADLGALSAHAPAWGLAVLECGAAGAAWRKHDFPCLTHFQRAGGLAGDFGAGLDGAERRRLERILDGGAFAAWPTWLSVSPSGRALYFIPR
jgi:FAD/FMN-containing dehydrogenase